MRLALDSNFWVMGEGAGPRPSNTPTHAVKWYGFEVALTFGCRPGSVAERNGGVKEGFKQRIVPFHGFTVVSGELKTGCG